MQYLHTHGCFRLAALILSLTLLALPGCGGEADTDAADTTLTGTPDAASSDASASAPTTPTAPPEPAQPEPPAPDNPRAAEGVTAPDGFQVEKLYATYQKRDDPESEGSWVALCAAPGNTLYATDQYGALYHITPAPIGDYETETKVVRQPIELRGAMGLRWAFDTLYIMESRTGLVRATDSDGDGLIDSKQLLVRIEQGGEHGSHAIVPTPDGKGLYIIAGNETRLPEVAASRVPRLWDEDQVLPREDDANGHAAGRLAPGGWIARCDPDGGNLTLHCNGFRNAYDLDVAPNGEVFTYDADMEWDLGLPWYRPTRVNHAVSGAEFGWRHGSGKWPTYYEDSLPGAIDIGPGSPTGVVFGTGASFPAKYQSALYLLDWTYGVMYAAHLEPDGASYTGVIEPFVVGRPLPLTDAVVGEDGALYFTTGGRRLESGVYRVVYYGNKDTTAPPVEPLNALAQLRRELEALHHQDPPADKLDLIWQNLGHRDRYVRYAARVAIEHQPVDRYLARAKAETDAMTRTEAGLALARHRHPDALAVLIGGKPVSPGDVTEQLAWLRAVGVAFARNGRPDDAGRSTVLARLDTLLPSADARVNAEVVRLKVFLKDPSAIDLALGLMNSNQTPTPPAWIELAAQNRQYGSAIRNLVDNPPPTDQLNYAFMLRTMDTGWTPQSRQTYFAWLNLATAGAGGNSYAGYIRRIREQAIETLSDQEKLALGPLLEPPARDNLPPLVQPKGPGRNWTVAQATQLVDGKLTNRDFDRGVGLYRAALCAQCHRVGDLGGSIGPDLTSVVHTYGLEDLMRAIIEPSNDISDQYELSIITTTDGQQVIGRIVSDDEQFVKVAPNVLSAETTDVPRAQVAKVEAYPASPMMQGLVNPLSADELRDLVAYILSAGDREHAMFKP